MNTAIQFLFAFSQSILILIFTVSTVTKLPNVKLFAQTIRNFRVVPRSWSKVAAWGLLTAEWIVAVFLLSGYRVMGFALAIMLLITFIAALASVIWRSIPTSCNCFGAKVGRVTIFDLIRNTGLLLCAVIGLVVELYASKELLSEFSNWPLFNWAISYLAVVLFIAIWLQLRGIARLVYR